MYTGAVVIERKPVCSPRSFIPVQNCIGRIPPLTTYTLGQVVFKGCFTLLGLVFCFHSLVPHYLFTVPLYNKVEVSPSLGQLLLFI